MLYPLLLTALGLLLLALAGLPLLLRQLPLSVPIVLVLLGAGLALLPSAGTPPDPREHAEFVERLTEFVVIVSLMGAGLKLDTALGWRSWAVTWRLLGIAMPLSIAGIALLGWGLLGMSLAGAVLLGAALAPTDPVLAADVQVGPPGERGEDRVRFALTSEAGLNDSLAFPFVNLAIAMAAHELGPGIWTLEWLARDVVWKLGVGLVMGWLVGLLAVRLLFRLPQRLQLASSGDGFVAVGVTLLAYGSAELVASYGFLAVFAAAVTIRAAERDHKIHHRLHDFAEEVERLAMAGLLLLFGAGLVSGLIAPLVGGIAVAALVAVLVVRPLAGFLSLVGFKAPVGERLAIAFFGIRGVGSVYYLAYGLNHGEFHPAEQQILWAATAAVITLSILLHGVTATPVMRRFSRKRDAG